MRSSWLGNKNGTLDRWCRDRLNHDRGQESLWGADGAFTSRFIREVAGCTTAFAVKQSIDPIMMVSAREARRFPWFECFGAELVMDWCRSIAKLILA